MPLRAVVQAEPFDRLHGVARAAILQRRLLEVAGAADVARQRAPPPTAMVVPGIMMPTAWMLRPVGMASRTSRVITVRVVMLCVSTTGTRPRR